MGYTKRKLPLNILNRILRNCNKIESSLNKLSISNKIMGLSGGSLKNVDLISDTELELTCRRLFDKVDTVLRIEAVVDKHGKAVLIVNRNDVFKL